MQSFELEEFFFFFFSPLPPSFPPLGIALAEDDVMVLS